MNGESLPTGPAAGEITLLLRRIEAGETVAADGILPLVYDELRGLAAVKMAREAAGHTLQPTALVHEAWLRLGGDAQPSWQNQAHFFGAAAEAMRRILTDRARNRRAVRHGGGQERVNFDDIEVAGKTVGRRQSGYVGEWQRDFLGATCPRRQIAGGLCALHFAQSLSRGLG
jgi:hypothetical protein